MLCFGAMIKETAGIRMAMELAVAVAQLEHVSQSLSRAQSRAIRRQETETERAAVLAARRSARAVAVQ